MFIRQIRTNDMKSGIRIEKINLKDESSVIITDDYNEPYIEIFNSKYEAQAFIDGFTFAMEYMDFQKSLVTA